MRKEKIQRMEKRIVRPAAVFVLLGLLFLASILGGCVKKYSRSDIKSYAKKISGRSNLTVSENYQEIQEDEEGYLDHLWTVVDQDSGVTFHVLDDYYWALEEVENKLLDDYSSCVFLALLEEGKIPRENGLSLKRTDISGIVQAELICSFTDLTGLEKSYQNLQKVRQALAQAGYADLSIPYTVKYNHPIRGMIDYEFDEGDTAGMLNELDETTLTLMRRNYLTCALDYRFDGALREFSQEEIRDLVHAPTTVRIYRISGRSGDSTAAENGSAVPSRDDYMEGVIGSPKFAGISFGTLYELLRQEGYEPEGNAWHFSVRAPDGSLLEFSYDFSDLSGFNDINGKLQKGYYYKRDDKKIRMSHYYDNHFEASEIEELTGLTVAEDRPRLSGQEGQTQ